MIKLIAFACVLLCVSGHGRLISPLTRVGNTGYENDPTGSSSNGGNNNDAWVCRHASGTNSGQTWTAGNTYKIEWAFSAAHVGDCDIYISYDVTADRSAMEWFKIANYFDCRSDTGKEMDLQLPTWLKAGAATLRFGWYALHQYPNVEFYSQCSDITVSNPGVNSLPTGIQMYELIEPAVFPLNANDDVGYPYRFPPEESWMTGPACACGFTGNSCALTQEGTTGHIGIGGDGVTACGNASTDPGDNTDDDDDEISSSIPRCGTNWADANSKCGTLCPGATDVECPSNEACYADVDNSVCVPAGDEDALDVFNCDSETWGTKSEYTSPPYSLDENFCQDLCSVLISKCDSDMCVCEDSAVNLSVFFASLLLAWVTL